MFANLRKLFKKNNKKQTKDASIERRAAKRALLPDARNSNDISLAPNKKKKKLPKTNNVQLTLSAKAHKGEEENARKQLKKELAKAESCPPDAPFAFSISLPEAQHDDVHQAIAVSLPELGAACKELKKAMRVKDISTTGIGLQYTGPTVQADTELTLILATKKAKLTTNLKATAIRHTKGILGACFHDLTRQQENLLAKLVLEGQKRQRAKRQRQKLPKEIQDLKL